MPEENSIFMKTSSRALGILTQPEETKQSLEAKLFRDLLGEGTTNVSG